MFRLLALLLLPSLTLVENQAAMANSTQVRGASILKSATEEDRLSHDKTLSEEQRREHKANYHQKLKSAFEALLSESMAGDTESMWKLGCASGAFQREGLTTEKDCIPWLRKAAILGQEEAPFELALKLLRIGNTEEKVDGFGWLKKSTKIGCRRWEAAVELARHYTYGLPEIQLKQNASEAMKWINEGANLMGCSKGEFMAINGLADPRAIKQGEILY